LCNTGVSGAGEGETDVSLPSSAAGITRFRRLITGFFIVTGL
jgi:hypothetical protein